MRMNGKQWNQGNLDQNTFAMERQHAAHEVQIDVPVERLFQRACLTGQPGWLPAGAARLCYSRSGHDEQNALWTEGESGPRLLRDPSVQTFWTTTQLDPEHHRYQAVLLIPELAVGTLDMEMEEHDGSTVVRFRLSCTVLSEAGSALFDEGISGRMGELLQRFGQALTDASTAEQGPPAARASYQPRRLNMAHDIVIRGDLDECFALACPVAELLWIDDWKFDLIYSESGKNETGCVFLEPSTGLTMLSSPGVNNYWYTTRYDAGEHLFEAVWLTRDLTMARWEVRMSDQGRGETLINWSMSYTSLGPKGSRIIGEPALEERMERVLRFLAASLKKYAETGEIYRLSHQLKVRLAASLIGAALGRHFRRLSPRDRSASNPPA